MVGPNQKLERSHPHGLGFTVGHKSDVSKAQAIDCQGTGNHAFSNGLLRKSQYVLALATPW
jgi:hypothetical protein